MIVQDPPSYNADDPPRSWLAAFRAAGDPRRAEHEKRYLRSEIEHYGVPVPAVRRVVRAFTRHNPGLTRTELLAVARSLWATRVHECRLAAALLLEARTDLLASRDTAVLEELIRESGTWALVDVLAGNAAGHLLLRLPVVESEYRRWAADEDQWVRRSGVLAFLQAVRQDAHVDRYLPVVTEIADPLLEDRRFFVRKAIGWVLREGGKRRPDLVFEWLRPRAGRVSGVTLREAVRYLPPASGTSCSLVADQRAVPSIVADQRAGPSSGASW
jgi:3-methyladenine DNA glycosylase AlkD